MLSLVLKALLFVALVPGVLVRLPPGASFKTQLVVHGVLFVVLVYYVFPMIERFENPNSKADVPCPGTDGMYVKCPSGDCRLKTDVHSPCN
jgi:membrane protein implicated in regulation of membrane protease activity